MALHRNYRCPYCQSYFWVTLQGRNDPPPDDCPICRNTGTAPELPPKQFTAGAPALLKGAAKNVDTMYRQMEEGAQFRADMAQEKFGLDSESANELKLTDMRDDARAGETSVKPLTADQAAIMANADLISRSVATAPQNPLVAGGVPSVGAAHPVQYTSSVGAGPHPYAGAKALTNLREVHSKTGVPMADNPSLEWKHQHGMTVR